MADIIKNTSANAPWGTCGRRDCIVGVIIRKGPCPMCRRQLKRSDLTEGKALNPPELPPEAAMASLFMAESKLEVLLREARPPVPPSCPGALMSGLRV